MSRDYTLRVLQSHMDRAKANRKKGKTVSGQPKAIKKLRPINNYRRTE